MNILKMITSREIEIHSREKQEVWKKITGDQDREGINRKKILPPIPSPAECTTSFNTSQNMQESFIIPILLMKKEGETIYPTLQASE